MIGQEQMMSYHYILVMGLPRSGTTWIAKILDSHPDTLYRHEADRGSILLDMPLAPDVSETEALKLQVDGFVNGLVNMKDVYVVASQPQFRKQYRSRLGVSVHRLNTIVAKLASNLGLDCPIFPVENYSQQSELHVVWKSVSSIARLGVFARALPASHSVVLLRHPCGHVASMLRGETQNKFGYPPSEDYDMFKILLNTEPARRRRLTLDYLASLHPTERLAWKWVILYEKALQDVEGLGNCISIRYEDFCLEPEKFAKQVFEFCNLPWSAATARFLKNSTAVENKKYYSVFKNPIRSAQRWQSDLSGEDIDRIYRVVQESELQRFYPRTQQRESAIPAINSSSD
jgi:Sulfotransferase family